MHHMPHALYAFCIACVMYHMLDAQYASCIIYIMYLLHQVSCASNMACIMHHASYIMYHTSCIKFMIFIMRSRYHAWYASFNAWYTLSIICIVCIMHDHTLYIGTMQTNYCMQFTSKTRCRPTANRPTNRPKLLPIELLSQ